MKNILVVSASARKNGDGIKVFNVFKEKFDVDSYTFEVLHLSDYKINTCIGCTTCFKKEKCFMKDDLDLIISKMKAVDAFVFITPVYNMNVSGLMKIFLDRTSYLLHKPVFYDKHAYIISTTDIGGNKVVTSYLKYMMNAFCINNTGATGVYAHALKHDNKYKIKLSKRFNKEAEIFKDALAKGGEYKPKFTQIVRFNLWRLKALKSKEKYPGDYNYWALSDLLHADYFYPIKLKKLEKILLKIIRKRITNMLEKRM